MPSRKGDLNSVLYRYYTNRGINILFVHFFMVSNSTMPYLPMGTLMIFKNIFAIHIQIQMQDMILLLIQSKGTLTVGQCCTLPPCILTLWAAALSCQKGPSFNKQMNYQETYPIQFLPHNPNIHSTIPFPSLVVLDKYGIVSLQEILGKNDRYDSPYLHRSSCSYYPYNIRYKPPPWFISKKYTKKGNDKSLQPPNFFRILF